MSSSTATWSTGRSSPTRASSDAAGAGSGPAPQKPSDDPSTPIPDDPTRNVVGNVPLVDAYKTVQIQVDNGSPGIVDPGDVLRYTIAISNAGAAPATGVVFTDAVPANTTYVADSVRLNGLALGQPGRRDLAAGLGHRRELLRPDPAPARCGQAASCRPAPRPWSPSTSR